MAAAPTRIAVMPPGVVIAAMARQNLLPDETGRPVRHPLVAELFGELRDGIYQRKAAHDTH